MIVDNFHVFSAAFDPPKANPVLIIDADAVLPSPIPEQGFEAITWRHTQVSHLHLKDLCALGGWRSPQTILTCYVQADETTQREALATRKEIRVAQG